MSHSKILRIAGAGAVTAAMLAAAGCASEPEQPKETVAAATVSEEYDLAGVCPETVVIQMDWKPQVEYGTAFQLLGEDYEINADAKNVVGSLSVDGYDTGVDVEIRNNIMGQSVAATMYTDDSIYLGFMNTDSQISAISNDMPFTMVVAPIKASPLSMLWNPEAYPGAKTMLDVAKEGATFVVMKGAAFAPLMIEHGVPAEAFDYSHVGSPARFVSEGNIVQQGFATAEPYMFEHELPAWGKPVAYELLRDIGYNVYPEPYVMRTDRVASQSACLTKLVPIIQKAAVAFANDPSWATKLIVEAVAAYNEDWTYSEGQGNYAAQKMVELDLIGDEDGVAAGIDMNRVQSIVDTFGPVLAGSGVAVPDGLKADDLATTEFLDTTISYE